MYRTLERQGSGVAPHPTESTADASQLGGLPTVRLKLGCFNCGIDQAMLSKDVHQKNLSRVIAKAVAEQDLHMVRLLIQAWQLIGSSQRICRLKHCGWPTT